MDMSSKLVQDALYKSDRYSRNSLEKGELRFICKLCSKRNRTIRGLKVHLRKVHNV